MASGLRTTILALILVVAQADEEDVLVQAEVKLFEKYALVFYIALWCLSTIGYQIFNKEVLISYPFPWAVAFWQQAFGLCILLPRWRCGIRPTPRLTMQQAIRLVPAAVFHLMCNVAGALAFSAGAVSFVTIVKSSEPVLSSLLNFLLTGDVLNWKAYLCLVPIIGGVALASETELSFNWLCFGMAMVSNLGAASRSVYSKKLMGERDIGENMDPMNVFAVLTIMAATLLFPISLAIVGPSVIVKGFMAAHAAGGLPFLFHMLGSGGCYFMYNEAAFLALSKLDPVSHGVSKTMIRVLIVVTTAYYFQAAMTPLGVVGCCMAMSGTLLYSLS